MWSKSWSCYCSSCSNLYWIISNNNNWWSSSSNSSSRRRISTATHLRYKTVLQNIRIHVISRRRPPTENEQRSQFLDFTLASHFSYFLACLLHGDYLLFLSYDWSFFPCCAWYYFSHSCFWFFKSYWICYSLWNYSTFYIFIITFVYIYIYIYIFILNNIYIYSYHEL